MEFSEFATAIGVSLYGMICFVLGGLVSTFLYYRHINRNFCISRKFETPKIVRMKHGVSLRTTND